MATKERGKNLCAVLFYAACALMLFSVGNRENWLMLVAAGLNSLAGGLFLRQGAKAAPASP